MEAHGQLPHPLSSSFLSVPDLLCELARRHVVLHCVKNIIKLITSCLVSNCAADDEAEKA